MLLVRRFKKLSCPSALLAVFLQGVPASKVIVAAIELILEAPARPILQAAALAASALGAIDSVAGASSSGGVSASATLVADIPLPTSDTTGSPFKMDVTVTGPAVTFAKSWDVTNTLPPGITVVGGTLVGNLWVINDSTSTKGIITISGSPTQAGLYTVKLEAWQDTNRTGSVTTGTTTINVSAPVGSLPTITAQPSSITVNAGSSASFSVTASSNQALQYQWYKDSSPVSGATSATLQFASAQLTDAGTYSVTVKTAAGEITSAAATLTVNDIPSAPTFAAQPESQTIATGSTVVFNASSNGAPLPTYQWTFNGVPISGATAAMYVLNGATAADAGSYTCVASNTAGVTTSAPAILVVSSTSDIGRLVNISCRAGVGTGGNILIAGFVVGGSGNTGNQSILARASGPALVPFGVTGTLADPALQLYSGTTVLGTSEGWGGDASIAATALAVGAFAWGNSGSHDSALLESLPAGAYTVNISGQSGDTGVALAEVYDATPTGTYTPSKPRIVNISARVEVGTGSNVLIAGFVIGGSTSRTVLIRASGPALIPFNVAGTLPDPELQLYSGTTLVASNSSWAGNPFITASANSVGAFAWDFASSTDSAILATLPPGAYTAKISGASGDTGVALVEIYEVP